MSSLDWLAEEAKETLIYGIYNGKGKLAEGITRGVVVADKHGLKDTNNKTPKECLRGMLSCPILREFAKERKKEIEEQQK